MHRVLTAIVGLPLLQDDPKQTVDFLARINPYLQQCANHEVVFTKDTFKLVASGDEHALEQIRNLLVREPSRTATISLTDIPPSTQPKFQLEDLHLKPDTLKAIVAERILTVEELTQFSPLELRRKCKLSRRQIENIQFCLDGLKLALSENPKPTTWAA